MIYSVQEEEQLRIARRLISEKKVKSSNGVAAALKQRERVASGSRLAQHGN